MWNDGCAQPVSVLILTMPPGAMTRKVSIMIRTFRPTRESIRLEITIFKTGNTILSFYHSGLLANRIGSVVVDYGACIP